MVLPLKVGCSVSTNHSPKQNCRNNQKKNRFEKIPKDPKRSTLETFHLVSHKVYEEYPIHPRSLFCRKDSFRVYVGTNVLLFLILIVLFSFLLLVETTKDQLFDLYEEFGEVMEVYVPVDRSTGNGRGFAFVTMKEEDVETAIAQTNGLDFEGRKLVVSVPLRKCVTRMKCEHPIPPACYVCLLELTLFNLLPIFPFYHLQLPAKSPNPRLRLVQAG